MKKVEKERSHGRHRVLFLVESPEFPGFLKNSLRTMTTNRSVIIRDRQLPKFDTTKMWGLLPGDLFRLCLQKVNLPKSASAKPTEA